MHLKCPIPNLDPNDPKVIQAYESDSGVDIHVRKGTKVYAAASGRVLYSEFGHTPWGTVWNPREDTPYSILMQFDKPYTHNDVIYYYMWYTHMSQLVYKVRDGIDNPIHITQGAYLGKTGIGNLVPHLHFGILKNRLQQNGDFMEPFKLQKLLKSLLKKGGEQK